nr:unnamed protein product [Callosobruchus analis]
MDKRGFSSTLSPTVAILSADLTGRTRV